MKRLPVTQRHYDLLTTAFPEVFAEKRFIRLLHHLLFARSIDKESGWPRIPRYQLAQMEEKEKHLAGHRYSGKPFLEDFADAVGSKGIVKIYGYDYTRKKSRTATLVLPDELALAVEEEMCRTQNDKLIDLLTGESIRPRVLQTEQAERNRGRKTFPQEESSPAATYAHWLNQVPSQVFSDVVKNLPLAFAVARTLDDRAKRMANLGTLFRMATLGATPVYKTTKNTPRIYTDGSSAAGLSGKVRRVLFGGGKGTFNADLEAAQLAILARIWNLETTTTLLTSGQKVWPTILSGAGLPNTETAKVNVKKFVYSTAFGKEEPHLKGFATQHFGRKGSSQLFNSPIIQELLEGRRQRQQQMQDSDGFLDPFGVNRKLADAAKQRQNGKPMGEEQALKMLMAYEAQAYEFALMEPVLELAQATKEFRILFWLHDGVYLRITQPERADYYLNKLTAAVAAKAEELGIHTHLAIESI